MPSHKPRRVQKEALRELRHEVPKEAPAESEKNPPNRWQKLGTGEKVLAFLALFTLLAASLVVPEVRDFLHLKKESVIAIPPPPVAKPPVEIIKPETDEGKQSSPARPKLKYAPMPNAPDVDEKLRSLIAKRRTPGSSSLGAGGFGFSGGGRSLFRRRGNRSVIASPPVIVSSDVARRHLISRVEPDLTGLLTGRPIKMVLTVVIGYDGIVMSATVVPPPAGQVRNDPEVEEAVIDAVRQWKYQPFVVLGGDTSIVSTLVTFFGQQEP